MIHCKGSNIGFQEASSRRQGRIPSHHSTHDAAANLPERVYIQTTPFKFLASRQSGIADLETSRRLSAGLGRQTGIHSGMRTQWLIAAGLALSLPLASAFSNPVAPFQGCVDLGCPTTDDNNTAVCDMGVGVADATIVEGILPVPGSDIKLSVALTRSTGHYDPNPNTKNGLTYDYTLWTIQPAFFNLTTGDARRPRPGAPHSKQPLPEVCGFFFRDGNLGYSPWDYDLPNDDGERESLEVEGTRNTTECRATGYTSMCMRSLEDILASIDVNNGTELGDSARCAAIAAELQDRVRVGRESECEGAAIMHITGAMILGPGAPTSDKESPVKSGDYGACFPTQDTRDMFVQTATLSQSNSFVLKDDYREGVVPDLLPPRWATRYLPLMTVELDGEGKVAGNATFVCLKTLDQAYWATYWEENAGGAVSPGIWWVSVTGLCFVAMVGWW